MADITFLGLNRSVCEAICLLMQAFFPAHFGEATDAVDTDAKSPEMTARAREILTPALAVVLRSRKEAEKQSNVFFDALPSVREVLDTDIEAAYYGDPAATGRDEVILTYPGFYATCIYRIAHLLYLQKVPIIPRMMSEYAHRQTGIDIHPGAEIGRYFFIDHGTGVVIGETATIGEHVKIYQHVTLGAKSFKLGEDGHPVKGIKRHPDIGNGVVIYAGATILGGETVIGDNCVIGGNAWVTKSIPANETVTIRGYVKKRSDGSEGEK